MGRYKICLIIIMCSFMCIYVSCVNCLNDQNSHDVAKNISEKLSKLNKPSHVVLAIDSSASMDNISQSAEQTANEILNIVKTKNDKRIKIGYVIWSNTTIAKSSNLSYVHENDTFELKRLKIGGNTCFGLAINESISLLEKEDENDIYNIIIIISDGIENCNNGSKFDCIKFKEKNEFNNIYIYPIQLGSEGNSSLLDCLRAEVPENENTMTSDKSQTLNAYYGEIKTPLTIQMMSKEVSRKDLFTNMNISKSVTHGPFGPRVTLKFVAPGVEALKTNIVIALDSSGSLGKGGRNEYGNSIRESMPKILEKIEREMPLSNVSIVSWDDNIDFAYSPLENNISSEADLVPISKAKREIEGSKIFLNLSSTESLYRSLMDDLLGFSLLDYPDEYYYCNETELTNLNVGLECARDILSNSIQGNLDGTLKLILFVVARSEYTPCNEDLISRAKRENCNIHTVGLGVIDESELNKELIKIAGDKYNLTGDKLKYHYSAGSSIWNNAAVSDAIDAALGQYYKENLSNNIVVVDTFYPYLQYVNGTINATINGAKCAKTERYTKNQDETTMLEIALDKELCMKPGDIIEIVFDTSLNLSLPIDVVGPGRVDDYYINYNTSTSYIGYKWLGNDRLYKIPLPECVLSTEMGRI